ncbi:MAG: HAMP domain-containing protein [Burkholderiales bacterium]|nr:HAMP domain-containing protein [Burkholderiales bacterium]
MTAAAATDRTRWPRTLLGRHLGLLVLLIVAGQLCAAALVRQWVIQPRITQAAQGVAAQVAALRTGLQALPAAQRAAFVERFNGAVAQRTAPVPGTPWRARPSRMEQRFLDALAQQLPAAEGAAPPPWRRDAQGTLWVQVAADGATHWLRLPALFPLREATGAWMASVALGLLLALVGVWRLQRRLAAPLQQVVQAAQALAQGQEPPRLPEQGPHELATVGRSFNHMAQALAQAERERALMLAGVSHDLRTPLTKLRLAVEISSPRLDADLAASMARSIEAMDGIVGQFLDFARLGEHEAPAHESLDALATAVAQAQADHGRALGLELAGVPPCAVQPQLLRRALDNLVENAWRHGAPPVLLRTGQAPGQVWIEVQDHGSGVPADDLARIRQPFARGNAQARSGAPGAGLGLAIAERAARAHGGRLELDSAPGQGLRARLSLPV